MLELMYDKDVVIAGAPHTLELYVDAAHAEALAVLVPLNLAVPGACEEVWALVRDATRHLAPLRRLRVLLCLQPRHSYRWLETEPPPPHWRDAPREEVRSSGLAWA